MHLFRTRLVVFALLVAAFVAAVSILNRWGPGWARAAYEPVLTETVRAAFVDLRYGDAERIILRALEASPEYAPVVLDLTAGRLCVIPETAYRLREIFVHGISDGRSQGEERPASLLNATRTAFAQGDYETVVDWATGPGLKGTAGWQLDYLRVASQRRLGRYGPESRLAPAPEGMDPYELAPEINRDCRYYGTVPVYPEGAGKEGVYARYMEAVADFELGRMDYARKKLSSATDSPNAPWRHDAMYRLGLISELEGKRDAARRWYEKVVAHSASHADAARGLLRVNGQAHVTAH